MADPPALGALVVVGQRRSLSRRFRHAWKGAKGGERLALSVEGLR
jgi:hypothetical protein